MNSLTTSGASVHPDWDALVDYWLGDTEAAVTEALDAHLMQCDACGRLLDEVIALSRGVRDGFSRGAVASILSPAFVERLKAAGRRVREYRVPRNGSVRCSVDPDDDVLVSRLAAPLGGVSRVDALLTLSLAPGVEARLTDIPFDPAAGEVVLAPKLAEVRRQPDHEMVLRLLAVEEGGERELGRYTFMHCAATRTR